MRIRMTCLIVLLAAATVASAAELDPAYVKAFGWGKICVSDKGFPAKASFDASLFNYKDGKFVISSGGENGINYRMLTKDGKTYGFYINKLKQANAQKMKTFRGNFHRVLIFVSHDEDGKQLFDKWPTKLSDQPQWNPMMKVEQDIETAVNWTGAAATWDDICQFSGQLGRWLKDAKPGYRVYIMDMVGFTRDCPEEKYWDKDQLRDVIPIEYVSAEPVAACTVEVGEAQ